jgi:Mce-associated membrane protein
VTALTGSESRTDDDVAEETDTTTEAARRSTATVLLVLMSCAVLVVAVACVFLLHQHSQDVAIKNAREQGLTAAQSEAKDLLSYNYRTLDYDLQKAKSEMTPGMAKSFGDYWQIFRPSVVKSQTQALTQIQTAGVTDATPGRVEVLLFVKMISVNAAHKEPQVDTSWPRLVLKKVGKKWLIDGPRMTTPPPASATPPSPAPSVSKAPSKAPGKKR